MSDITAQGDRKMPYPPQIQPGRFESSNLPSIDNYNRELFRVRASRLVDLLPDELVIQEKTVSIIRNQFLVSYIETIPVNGIRHIVYGDTLFFASITIFGNVHELGIKGLPRGQAITAKNILDGLLLEQMEDVDVAQLLRLDEHRDMLAQKGARQKFP
jgi:hypothetical protein